MATAPQSKPSFSPHRKWLSALHLLFVVLVVFAVVVMVNYLSQGYFKRLQLSARTRIELSPMTLNLLQSLTNKVKVTIFYNKDDPMYSTVAELLSQYAQHDRNLKVETVDYERDPGQAQKLKMDYKLGTVTEKNIVIFDAGTRIKIVPGEELSRYVLEQVPNDKEREFRKKPTEFFGERLFTGALLAVTSPRLNAYFLQGHGEPRLESNGDLGFVKLKSVLEQNCIGVQPLWLLATNPVPPDCNLLVIAGPTDRIFESELNKIDEYLTQGGRALVLFSMFSLDTNTDQDITGLDKLLAKWGVAVGEGFIADTERFQSGPTRDMLVLDFNRRHPLVNPLLQSVLYLIHPRSVGALKTADPSQVVELAFTSPKSVAYTASGKLQSPTPQRFPLMVAVEKSALQNVLTERGATRIVVVGDSAFLGNVCIDSVANRDFAGYAANWLLDRTELLRGVGPQKIQEYKILLTKAQLQSAELILLGAMPGSALLLGGLVWLCRRK
jgi:ABC-type uncharacterized transport system involved in gliding motility auxiliary subunit